MTEMDDTGHWEWRENGDDSEDMGSPTKRQRQHREMQDDQRNNHAFPWEIEAPDSHQEMDDDDDCEGLGLMEAFESFNLRAEKRVQELLLATDTKLFDVHSDAKNATEAPPPNTPSYVLMSDQYRQSRPPQFHHWRQCFPYLQIVGKSSFEEVPDEHIQIRPAPASSVSRTELPTGLYEGDGGEMVVVGKKLHLQVDLSDPPQEELIMACVGDGEMEEVLEDASTGPVGDVSEDADGHESRPLTGALSCPSPRSSRANEDVDRITQKCFTAFIPPVVGALCERILRRQQDDLKTARERHEEAVRLQKEAEIAAQEEKQRREELAEQERIRYEAEVAQVIEEERAREEARREELLRQQREENDEEEIKIRTLAYTHTREWYQPNKKCFSHRGRKMTYLKPVLKAQQEGELCDAAQVDNALEASHDDAESQVYVPTKPPPTETSNAPRRSRRRKSSPSQLDIENAKSPAISPQSSPTLSTSSSRPSSGQDPSKAALKDKPRTQLPLLPKASHTRKKSQSQAVDDSPRKSMQGRKRSWDDEEGKRSPPPPAQSNGLGKAASASVAAPSRVYAISPYRIPPAILKNELKRDAVATGRQQRPLRKAHVKADAVKHEPQ